MQDENKAAEKPKHPLRSLRLWFYISVGILALLIVYNAYAATIVFEGEELQTNLQFNAILFAFAISPVAYDYSSRRKFVSTGAPRFIYSAIRLVSGIMVAIIIIAVACLLVVGLPGYLASLIQANFPS